MFSHLSEQEARQLSALVAYLRELIAALEAECLANAEDASLRRLLVKMKVAHNDAVMLGLLRQDWRADKSS